MMNSIDKCLLKYWPAFDSRLVWLCVELTFDDLNEGRLPVGIRDGNGRQNDRLDGCFSISIWEGNEGIVTGVHRTEHDGCFR